MQNLESRVTRLERTHVGACLDCELSQLDKSPVGRCSHKRAGLAWHLQELNMFEAQEAGDKE